MRASHIRVSRSYKKGIFLFLLVTIVLVFIILYFTLTKAVITLTPEIQQVETQFFVDVTLAGSAEDAFSVKGTIEESIIIKKEKFKATGLSIIEPAGDGDIVGTVTLFNTLDSKMELVATTRLLSDDNVLYRIKKKATIDAGSSIEATIYADKSDEFSLLKIGRLTIPGLSTDLQQKVYAENNKAISKDKQTISVVQKTDIEQGSAKLKDKVKQEALNELKLTYGDNGPVILAQKGEVQEVTTDTPIGAEADEFEITIKMKIISVFLDKSETLKLIGTELDRSIEDGQKILRIDSKKTFYTIEKYELDTKIAHIRIKAVGHATLDNDHPLLDQTKITGSTKEQVEIYYKSFDDIKNVDVLFTPFWVKRVPKMLDHVEIRIR